MLLLIGVPRVQGVAVAEVAAEPAVRDLLRL